MRLKKDFHSRLFGFAGFSGSGKTTLIEKLIKKMNHLHIGYIKHDAHHFEMDQAGKDTYRQFTAGAQIVYINDSEHFALQGRGEGYSLEKEFFKDCDIVLVEGHKYADHPKFLFLDAEHIALKEYKEGKIKNILATIGDDPLEKLGDLPSFHRDDVEGISKFIQKCIEDSIQKTELFGLVLAGGHSTRMGEDKALLNYHGQSQSEHLHSLITNLGLKTFISCRKDQGEAISKDLPVIHDRFLDFGPLGGILSAMTQFPDHAFLVVACDLPLVTKEHIKKLLGERSPLKQATAFFNEERKMFEPLFAIYEPQIYTRLMHFLGERVTCPQKVLFNSSIKKLSLPKQDFLLNANTPEERRLVSAQLEGMNL